MKILALDLATNCGYAYNNGSEYQCGTWLLATDKELRAARAQRLNRRLDPRVTKMFQQIECLQKLHGFDVITFEDIEFSTYTLQCQLWASLRSAMWLGAYQTKPIFDAVPVATLKKFATSNGKATKEAMVRALIRADSAHFFTHADPAKAWWQPPITRNRVEIDDNAVDAIWLWRRAATLFNRKPIR